MSLLIYMFYSQFIKPTEYNGFLLRSSDTIFRYEFLGSELFELEVFKLDSKIVADEAMRF